MPPGKDTMTTTDEAGENLASSTPTEYIVVVAQIVGDPDRGYTTVYSWDGRRCATANDAIDFGWRLLDHDDFNIGHVQGDRLVWFGWQHDELDESPEDFAEIADQLGLVPARASAVTG